jgi:hypothetical protein
VPAFKRRVIGVRLLRFWDLLIARFDAVSQFGDFCLQRGNLGVLRRLVLLHLGIQLFEHQTDGAEIIADFVNLRADLLNLVIRKI